MTSDKWISWVIRCPSDAYYPPVCQFVNIFNLYHVSSTAVTTYNSIATHQCIYSMSGLVTRVGQLLVIDILLIEQALTKVSTSTIVITIFQKLNTCIKYCVVDSNIYQKLLEKEMSKTQKYHSILILILPRHCLWFKLAGIIPRLQVLNNAVQTLHDISYQDITSLMVTPCIMTHW